MLQILYLLLLSIFASCQPKTETSFSVNGGNFINTYDSPNAYYGKPISSMFINPYAIYPNELNPDNDILYVPPKFYGM